MIGNDKTVRVTLVAVAQPYVTGLNQASAATKKLGTDIDRVGDRSKGFESRMAGASAAVKGMAVGAAALAGTALVSFLSSAVTAAGNLEQSMGGVDAVFKESADKINDFGKNSAEAVGLSRNAFNELVTVSGALLKNKGLENFADQALDLVKIGADLAAQFGGPTSQAVEALNAAMRGESDPIERYGISLNETAVNAELAAKGLSGLEGAALDTAKAQARIDIILRQSADAAGAFAREADTLQGQQQRLNAEWEDAKVSLGQALLPALTDVVRLMRDGVDAVLAIQSAFSKVPGPVWAAAAALAAVHLAGPKIQAFAVVARSTMSAAAEAIDYAGQAARRAGGGFGGAVVGLQTFTGQASLAAGAARGLSAAGKGMLALVGGPWGLAFIGAAAIVGKFMQNNADAKRRVEELTATLDEQTGAVTANTRAWVVDDLQKSGTLDTAKRLGLDLQIVTDAALGEAEAIDQLRDALARLEPTTTDASDANRVWADGTGALSLDLSNLEGDVLTLAEATGVAGDAARLKAEAMGDDADATAAAGDAAAGAAGGQRDLAAEMEAAAKAAEDARKELDDYIDSLTNAGMLQLDVRSATRQQNQALIDLREALAEQRKEVEAGNEAQLDFKNGFDVTTEAGIKFEGMLDDLIERTKARADAVYAATGEEANFRAALAEGEQQVRDVAAEMGLGEEAIQRYVDEFYNVPDSVRTEIEVDTENAASKVLAITRLINGVPNKTAYVNVVTREIGSGGSTSTRGGFTLARGGAVFGPGTSTSDSIPAWLSDGEYVVKAAAVAKYGMRFMHDLNAMRLAGGGPVGSLSMPGASIDYGRLAAAIGARSYTETTNNPITIGTLVAADVRDFEHKAQQRAAYARMRRQT